MGIKKNTGADREESMDGLMNETTAKSSSKPNSTKLRDENKNLFSSYNDMAVRHVHEV